MNEEETMRKKTVLIACLALCIGIALPVWGGTVEQIPPIPQPEYTIEGKITFVERDGTVIIRPGAPPRTGPDRIVYLKEYTKISRNGAPAGREDVKPGVVVWVSVGPMREALEMKITGP
jgi:hypothetical protein